VRSGSDKSHREKSTERGEKGSPEEKVREGVHQDTLSVSRDVRAARSKPCRHLGRVFHTKEVMSSGSVKEWRSRC
jgi:hypothetical protein